MRKVEKENKLKRVMLLVMGIKMFNKNVFMYLIGNYNKFYY